MSHRGYEGLGCSTCLADYARADSNPFICLKCAACLVVGPRNFSNGVIISSIAITFLCGLSHSWFDCLLVVCCVPCSCRCEAEVVWRKVMHAVLFVAGDVVVFTASAAARLGHHRIQSVEEVGRRDVALEGLPYSTLPVVTTKYGALRQV